MTSGVFNRKRLKALIGLFLISLFWPEICSGQDFNALFQDAVFTKSVELGVPGSVCIVSRKGSPIAVMWRWWGKDVKLHLKSHWLKSTLGQKINPTDVKVLDRSGRLVTTGTRDGVTITLGTEPRYLVVSQEYHPPPAFADDLSRVKVSLLRDRQGKLKVLFENLTKNAVIRIFDNSGKLVKEIKYFKRPQYQWDCTHSRGMRINPGVYRYRIFDKGGAVVGTITIPK